MFDRDGTKDYKEKDFGTAPGSLFPIAAFAVGGLKNLTIISK